MALQLYPSEIFYSQESISCHFSGGNLIGETLDELCEGRLNVSDIDPISVTKVNGRWITQNNRRLWVFRHLERLGKCKRIPVNSMVSMPQYHMTIKCGGRNVDVRGDPGGRWHSQSSSSFLWTAAKVIGIGAIVLLTLGKR
ncbi:uncharacterized protein LOC132726597 [Ruditapes philippinarum]|uniref:uncharacterized protein LOC132726597 n=1 Tax=Ruditapes philippinarum TaxID=129788 RepID=UPI00295BA1FA|nr:uncharacterized protein LOC132726597 [Ruditapes philippinarum]